MSIPYMPLYVADYLGDTQHLSAEQHGAYLLLLMALWRAGGRLPNDAVKLARIVRLSPSKWARIAGDVMAFFTVDGEEITQKRLAAEIEKASKKSQVRSEAGKAGAEAKALKNNKPASANASRLLKHSSEPEPEKSSDADASGAVPAAAAAPVIDLEPVYTDDRHRLWGEAPAILATFGIDAGRGRKLVGSWLKQAGDDCRTVLSAIQRARDHRVAEPIPWITAAIKPRTADDRRNVHPLSRAFDRIDERIGAMRSG